MDRDMGISLQNDTLRLNGAADNGTRDPLPRTWIWGGWGVCVSYNDLRRPSRDIIRKRLFNAFSYSYSYLVEAAK